MLIFDQNHQTFGGSSSMTKEGVHRQTMSGRQKVKGKVRKRPSRLAESLQYKQISTRQITMEKQKNPNGRSKLYRGLVPLSSSNLHEGLDINELIEKPHIQSKTTIEKPSQKSNSHHKSTKAGMPITHPVRLVKGSTYDHGVILNQKKSKTKKPPMGPINLLQQKNVISSWTNNPTKEQANQ